MIDTLVFLSAVLGIAVTALFGCVLKLKSEINELQCQQKRIREALVILQDKLKFVGRVK